MVDIPINDVTPRNRYEATGGEPVFDYDFVIFDNDHIRVQETDPQDLNNPVTLVRGVDYNVTGVGNDNGGTIALLPGAYPTGATPNFIYTLTRVMPYERLNDYQFSGDFESSDVNADFDTAIMLIQQLNRLLNSTARLDDTDELTSLPIKIESAVNRAGRVFSFNAAGNGIEAGPLIGDIGNAAQFAQEAKDARDAAQVAEQGAVNAQGIAESARDDAISARNAAQSSESNAAASELAASISETNAATSEGQALSHKNDAENARDIAIGAKNDAESARDAAQLSQTAAATSATNANTSAGQSDTARIAAETARDLSQAWAEGHEPGGSGTKSSKEWSEEAELFRDEAQIAVGGTRVTVNDTTASVLNDKIVGGNGIITIVASPGGNEQLRLETYPTFDIYSWAKPYLVQSDRKALTIKESTIIRLVVDGVARWRRQAADEVLSVESLLDTGSALTAGKDYYLYLCDDGAGGTEFVVSLNSTFPAGYTANNSRKIGGFHTLCVNAGTISGHPLSGYLAGQILPASVWCLNHRPHSNPEGMVYDGSQDVWIDIYLQSGTGSNARSIFGATVTDTRQYSEFMEDQFLVQKALLNDEEFASSMEGSNQQTAIAGSASPSPKTAGGHLDTAGRRMISNIGVEEGCGFLWQFLASTSASGGSSWTTITGSKGNVYGPCHVLLAGGAWDAGASCGSRSRAAHGGRAAASANFGGRGRSRARAIL